MLLRNSSFLSTSSSDLTSGIPSASTRYTIYAIKPSVPDSSGSAAVSVPGFWLSFKSYAQLAQNISRNCLYIGSDNALVPAGMAMAEAVAIIPAGFRRGEKDDAIAPVGLQGGRWFTFGTSNDLPLEQSPDDALSLVFDTHVGTQADTLLVGNPRV